MDIIELLKQQILSQSDASTDTVPAMLTEGEYVLPTDIVSILGNGDTKAGAGVLDMLMEFIRGLGDKNGSV